MARDSKRLWRNALTYTGTVLAGIGVFFTTSFLFFDLTAANPNPYVGLFTFLVFPSFIATGVGLVIVGLLFARWRAKRRREQLHLVEYYPRIDLNLKGHRRVLTVIATAIVITLPFIGFTSYHGYEYTDSNEFCGGVCHSVMSPQYIAHQNSPHARVECAACHIGPGASWYVKSKLSGLRQVFATVLDSYPRPIPTAIDELRPARETCEECHWPQKFYGNQLITINHFTSDEANTPRPVGMLMRTGGNDPIAGPVSGIHWHMALGHGIEFIATDAELQEIPWVRSTDRETGVQRVYRSDGLSSSFPPPDGEIRTMDCISCHNRATHVFRAPEQAVDDALYSSPVLAELPFSRRELIAAVSGEYATLEEGIHRIATSLADFYELKYPKVFSYRRGDVNRLIEVGQTLYKLSTFPEMKVTWETYPDNIGHKNYPGCFRCHQGNHIDDVGRTISRDCKHCHDFLISRTIDDGQQAVVVGDFTHPTELKGSHALLRCDLCHSGGVSHEPTCDGCHASETAFIAGSTAELQDYDIPADGMDGIADCQDCHDLEQPRSVEVLDGLCLECHDSEEIPGGVAAMRAEATALLEQAEASEDPEVQRAVDAIRDGGPLHNMEATRQVLTELSAHP